MLSKIGDEEKKKFKEAMARDLRVTIALNLKSWEGRGIRAIITCYNCNKRRGIYSPKDEDFIKTNVASRQNVESVSGCYSFDDLLFDDNNPWSKVIVQKQGLTCEYPIDKSYYANAESSLKVRMICIHCGELGNDNEDFIYCMPQLREKNMTNG